MNDIDQPSGDRPDAPNSADLVDESEEGLSTVSKPSSRVNPRIYLHPSLVRKLVKAGVPDDISSIRRVVNALLDYAITSHQSELVNLTDLVAIEQSLADRVEELTAVNVAMTRVLMEIAGVVEVDQLYGSFREMALSKVPETIRLMKDSPARTSVPSATTPSKPTNSPAL